MMNNSWRRVVAALGLAFSIVHAPAQTPAPALVPIEDLFAEADYSSVELSPDGKYVAFLTTLGTGKVGIALMDLGTGKIEGLVAPEDENIKDFFWKGSEYIVYSGDIGGDESPALRSITVQAPKGGKRRVVAISESYNEDRTNEANFLFVVDEMKFDPYHFIAYGRKTTGMTPATYYSVDVRNGERMAIWSDGRPPRDNVSQVLDNEGRIRARSRYEGPNIIFEVRPQATALYVKVAEFPANSPKWTFGTFKADNETLYIYNYEHDEHGALHTLHLPTQKLSEPLFTAPEGEISGTFGSYNRSKLYGVSYYSDRLHRHFFDAGREKLQAFLDKNLPATDNHIVSISADEKIYVVVAVSDRDPGTYYVLDLNRGSMGAIGRINHRINPSQMRPMQPVEYKARDGLDIHGYLTLPAGAEKGKVPLVIHPHGGPFGVRDGWGFDPEVQFWANRGFAVLQINYRGSGGYGQSFEQAGWREWGGKMQNDLSDGVKWAIDQGIADPARVVIAGASYGGYAALAGVTMTPELYCLGVNYVGVSDLNILRRAQNGDHRANEQFVNEMLGSEKTYLHDHSPVNLVDRIRVPTLHAYGYNDPRVDFDHWKELEPKLKQFKKNYEIMILKDEGHGFRNEQNRIAFYKRLDAFLAKNMPK